MPKEKSKLKKRMDKNTNDHPIFEQNYKICSNSNGDNKIEIIVTESDSESSSEETEIINEKWENIIKKENKLMRMMNQIIFHPNGNFDGNKFYDPINYDLELAITVSNESYSIEKQNEKDKEIKKLLLDNEIIKKDKELKIIENKEIENLDLEKRLNKYKEDISCKICYENKSNILLQDCKHLCLCSECYNKMLTISKKLECPICNKKIKKEPMSVFRC